MATPATGKPPPRAQGALRHAADPSRLARRCGPRAGACLGRPWGAPGRPPAAHKARQSRGGLPRAAPRRPGPPRRLPPRSPLPSLSSHLANPHPPLPILGNRFAPLSRWEHRPVAFLPSTEPPLVDPNPDDRCDPSTLNEPPGILRGLQPSSLGGSWRVLGFHKLRLPQAGQKRRPLPQPVLVLCAGMGAPQGGEEARELGAGLSRGSDLGFLQLPQWVLCGSRRFTVHIVLG